VFTVADAPFPVTLSPDQLYTVSQFFLVATDPAVAVTDNGSPG
jgi:hypothetical protein